jgi:exopolysaccharide production protein ExoZ
MIYHLFSWWVSPFTADSVMGRVGVYGVAIFYVLSGITMFHVYGDRMSTVRDTRDFFIKRIFRIFPLLWLVTIAALVIQPRPFAWSDLVLNLTGLFGFVSWDTYFSAGVWSIGNELFFYALFPIIVALARTSRAAFIGSGMILGGGFIYFAFVKLSPTATIGEQWVSYINPANQAFLFFLGILVAYAARRVRMRQATAWFVLIVGVVIFVAWPVGTNAITDGTRLVFTLACVAICAAAYQLTFTAPRILHAPLVFLGEASYSIYLIHPVVNIAVLETPIASLPKGAIIAFITVTTLLVSWLSYRFLEKPMMKVGRTLTVKMRSALNP